MTERRDYRLPRHFVTTMTTFGRFETVQWDRDALRRYPDQGLAAQWQHVLIVLTRAALLYREMTQEELAREMGRETQYVRDRFGGQRWLTLVDAAALERVLGVHLVRPGSEIEIPVEWTSEPPPG